MEILKIQIEKNLQINDYVIKHLIFVKIRNMMDIDVHLSEWCMIFLIKKLLVEQSKNEIISNKKLSEELHKLIRKLYKRKLHSSFLGTFWGAELADIKLIRKFNKEI